jgi:hypothetical protein
MEFTPFLRRWLPKQVAAITVSPQPFRSKLLPDDDAVELELGALHTSSSDYELRQIARDGSAVSTASSGHDAATIVPAWQANSSSGATASSHQVDHPLAEAECLQSIPASLHDAADSLQQWQASAADIRLVVGALLESLGSCSNCRQVVEQLLASLSWDDACQQCKGTLLIW